MELACHWIYADMLMRNQLNILFLCGSYTISIKKFINIQNELTMKNKSSDSTVQRPEGERILNADLVQMDLNKLIQQIKEESSWADSDRNSITIFKCDTMRIVLLGLHENAELKTHKANGVISVQVLEGRLNFITAGETLSLGKGQMIALHENIPHSVIALAETFFLLTLSMAK